MSFMIYQLMLHEVSLTAVPGQGVIFMMPSLASRSFEEMSGAKVERTTTPCQS